MSNVQTLKSKWFLNFQTSPTPTLQSPPTGRHPKNRASNDTDENSIVILLDGFEIQKGWVDGCTTAQSRPRVGEVFHSGLVLDNVKCLGRSSGTPPALDLIEQLTKIERMKFYIALNKTHAEILGVKTGLTMYTSDDTELELINRGIPPYMDERHPSNASNHQKFFVFRRHEDRNRYRGQALVASADIAKARWDRTVHQVIDPERPHTKPTHEVGVFINGPAVNDLEHSFLERWNDTTSSQPPITSALSINPPIGTHSAQVLRTYGITLSGGYSWSNIGEFTIWSAYLHAIRTATKYIYIEDQYFFPFGEPPWFNSPIVRKRNWDLVHNLGNALKRGVKILVVIPGTQEDLSYLKIAKDYVDTKRKQAYDFLKNILQQLPATTTADFILAYPHNGSNPYFVHSKLMICDDEFVILGSANFNRRSMAYDSELDLAIVDGRNQFANKLRKKLWSDHTRIQPDRFTDWLRDFALVKNSIKNDTRPGLKLFNPNAVNVVTINKKLWNEFIDPYGGPPLPKD